MLGSVNGAAQLRQGICLLQQCRSSRSLTQLSGVSEIGAFLHAVLSVAYRGLYKDQ